MVLTTMRVYNSCSLLKIGLGFYKSCVIGCSDTPYANFAPDSILLEILICSCSYLVSHMMLLQRKTERKINRQEIEICWCLKDFAKSN